MKFIRRLLRNTHPTTKPEYLEDPIALKTSWFPINSGGANFCTHIASKKDSKVVFEKTIMYSFFPWVFIVMAGFIIVKIIQDKTYQNIDDNFIWTSVLSIVVLLIGIFLLFILKKRIVFDKSTGYYTRGRKKPNLSSAPIEESKNSTELSNIYALQIVSEYIGGEEKSYYSYELNLVLKSGKRLYIIDHGKLYILRKDAKLLSDFLNIPVWDAVGKD